MSMLITLRYLEKIRTSSKYDNKTIILLSIENQRSRISHDDCALFLSAENFNTREIILLSSRFGAKIRGYLFAFLKYVRIVNWQHMICFVCAMQRICRKPLTY